MTNKTVSGTVLTKKTSTDPITGKVTITYPEGSTETILAGEVAQLTGYTSYVDGIAATSIPVQTYQYGDTAKTVVVTYQAKAAQETTDSYTPKLEITTVSPTGTTSKTVSGTVLTKNTSTDLITGKETVTYPEGSTETIPASEVAQLMGYTSYVDGIAAISISAQTYQYGDGAKTVVITYQTKAAQETTDSYTPRLKIINVSPTGTTNETVSGTVLTKNISTDPITGKETITYPEGSTEIIPASEVAQLIGYTSYVDGIAASSISAQTYQYGDAAKTVLVTYQAKSEQGTIGGNTTKSITIAPTGTTKQTDSESTSTADLSNSVQNTINIDSKVSSEKVFLDEKPVTDGSAKQENHFTLIKKGIHENIDLEKGSSDAFKVASKSTLDNFATVKHTVKLFKKDASNSELPQTGNNNGESTSITTIGSVVSVLSLLLFGLGFKKQNED